MFGSPSKAVICDGGEVMTVGARGSWLSLVTRQEAERHGCWSLLAFSFLFS